MSKRSFAKTVVKSSSTPVHYIVAKDLRGRIAHYFIMCSQDRLRMIKAIHNGPIELPHFGKVLASGFGREPSIDTITLLKEEYGVDYYTFE
jgi:hypothetical protein